MKKLLLLFIPFLVACTSVVNEEPLATTEAVKTGFEIVVSGGEWNTLKNYDFGYTLQIPAETELDKCGEMVKVPVVVLGDSSSAFITPETIYYNDCDGETVQMPTQKGGNPWLISSAKVSNEAELLSFIQSEYGDTCEVNSVDELGRVEIKTGDPDSGCFLNYITYPLYNEALGFAYKFDIGQDFNFYLNGEGVDPIMADSFKF